MTERINHYLYHKINVLYKLIKKYEYDELRESLFCQDLCLKTYIYQINCVNI